MEKKKGEGIVLEGAELRPLFVDNGGDKYWSPEYQRLLRSDREGCSWKRFFPAADLIDDGRQVKFSYIESANAKESISRSRGIDEGGEKLAGIPRGELDAFFNALEDFRSLEQTATEPDKIAFIRGLRLPDPCKSPDKYRMYKGNDGIEHLAVLWGFENIEEHDCCPVYPLEDFRRRFIKFVLPDKKECLKTIHKIVLASLALILLIALIVYLCLHFKNKDVSGNGHGLPEQYSTVTSAIETVSENPVGGKIISQNVRSNSDVNSQNENVEVYPETVRIAGIGRKNGDNSSDSIHVRRIVQENYANDDSDTSEYSQVSKSGKNVDEYVNSSKNEKNVTKNDRFDSNDSLSKEAENTSKNSSSLNNINKSNKTNSSSNNIEKSEQKNVNNENDRSGLYSKNTGNNQKTERQAMDDKPYEAVQEADLGPVEMSLVLDDMSVKGSKVKINLVVKYGKDIDSCVFDQITADKIKPDSVKGNKAVFLLDPNKAYRIKGQLTYKRQGHIGHAVVEDTLQLTLGGGFTSNSGK